jgi:hypothetical protein
MMPPTASVGHTRSSSHASSMYSQESSPDSINTQMTTPARSPIRQHGPLLLPKIRPQDQEIHSPPKRFKQTPRKAATNPQRCIQTFPHREATPTPSPITFLPQQDNIPSHTRSMSTLCSPISFTQQPNQERRASSVGVDSQSLGKYGFPTYRQLPTYIPSATNPQTETFMVQNFYHTPQRTPSPLHQNLLLDDMAVEPPRRRHNHNPNGLPHFAQPGPSSGSAAQHPCPRHEHQTLLVGHPANPPLDQLHPNNHQHSIPGLHALLSIALPTLTFPTPPRTSLQPETETELQSIYNSFYATKLNAALSLSLGPRHLVMRPSKSTTDASFISNYTDDTSQLIYGRGLGRVVGLVKSFDRWNTGMRVEGNHRKVEYLRGLAHTCTATCASTAVDTASSSPRSSSSLSETAAENVPHFGYLEIQTIQLAAHDNPQTCTFEEVEGSFVDAGEENVVQRKPKMTALLALWYLHMLARDDVLAWAGGVESGDWCSG